MGANHKPRCPRVKRAHRGLTVRGRAWLPGWFFQRRLQARKLPSPEDARERATLRHATVLVNERTTAECGEGGFEAIVLRPPRGYVEPDPKTFEAIAALLNQMEQVVAKSANFTGNLPRDPSSEQDSSGDEKALPLQAGIIRRLQSTASKARLFESMAEKELQNQPLADSDYDEILHVGAVAEHDFLVYNSLASADLALST